MLKFKVVLVKRNKGYLAYLYDTKDVLETKTWSKKKILRLAQESILKEVKKEEISLIQDLKKAQNKFVLKEAI